MPYQAEATKILYDYLDNLDKREKKVFILLTDKWNTIQNDFDFKVLKLAEKENFNRRSTL